MQKRNVRRLFFVGALLWGALGLLGSHSAVQASGRNEARIEGVLIAVDVVASTVTIQNRAGSLVVAVSATTKIERNERRATLATLRVGDRAEARLVSVNSNVALKLEAVGP